MSKLSKFQRHQISRRTLLRGAGVAMALPWLESIPVWGETAVDNRRRRRPQAIRGLFMGCGINPDHWSAKGSGKSMELSKSLAPMEPSRRK